MSYQAIARQCNISLSHAWQIAKKFGNAAPTGPVCTSSILHHSKTIIECYGSGQSCAVIADVLGVDPQAVTLLVKRMGLLREARPYQGQLNHNWLDSIDTEEKAYFLGLLSADGWINKNTIFISLKASDRDLLVLLTQKCFPFIPVKTYDSSHPNAEPQARIAITSREWVQIMALLGITPAKSLILPDVASLIPATVRHHFIRGYFDGDGTICHTTYRGKRRVLISLRGTRAFLEGVHKAIGLPVGRIYKDRSSIHSLCYHGKARMLEIKSYMYADATLFMKRKHERFTW